MQRQKPNFHHCEKTRALQSEMCAEDESRGSAAMHVQRPVSVHKVSLFLCVSTVNIILHAVSSHLGLEGGDVILFISDLLSCLSK